MKNTILFLAFFAGLLFLTSCHKEKQAAQFELGIDLQSFFNNDQVQVEIDGSEVYNRTLTSDETFGIALTDSMLATIVGGTHTITIKINGVSLKTETFTVAADKYIGVAYNSNGQLVTLFYSDEPFLYL